MTVVVGRGGGRGDAIRPGPMLWDEGGGLVIEREGHRPWLLVATRRV